MIVDIQITEEKANEIVKAFEVLDAYANCAEVARAVNEYKILTALMKR